MTKIYCSYTIINPQEIYKPSDVISGIFYIESRGKEGKKDKKVKKVEIHLCEKYEQFEVHEKTKSKLVLEKGEAKFERRPETYSGWYNYEDILKKYKVKEKDVIKSGEIKEYPFEIQLPSMWSPKISGNLRDWHLALLFKQKTGMMLNLGSSPNSAYYVIPVQHSARPASAPSSAGEIMKESVILKSVEDQKLQKLSKLIKISSKINLDDISEILNQKRSIVLDKLIEWCEQFSFKIDGDFLLIPKDKSLEFINALNEMVLCPYCLSEVEKDEEICSHCGSSLQKEQ